MPTAPGLRTRGPTNLCSIGCSLPPLRDLWHLRLLAKLDKHPFWINERVTNRKPDLRGSLRVPFTQRQRLAPNRGQSSRQLLMHSKITYRSCLRWQVHSQINHSSYTSPSCTQRQANPSYKKGKYAKKAKSYHSKCQYILFLKLSPSSRNITQK
jgi:hypothetical protein